MYSKFLAICLQFISESCGHPVPKIVKKVHTKKLFRKCTFITCSHYMADNHVYSFVTVIITVISLFYEISHMDTQSLQVFVLIIRVFAQISHLSINRSRQDLVADIFATSCHSVLLIFLGMGVH